MLLVFEERGKPDYPGKNLSEQGREPTTNSTHVWRRRRDLNPAHTGGRRVLSPMRHPCSPSVNNKMKRKTSEFSLHRKVTSFREGPEGGVQIPFPSQHFFPNPTNQCPDPTDILTKHQSHFHFGFFSHSNPSPSDQNPIFPVQKQANPNSHFTPSGPSLE